MAVQIQLPDGKILEFDREPTALQVAERIGARLAKDTLGVKVNGSTEILDLRLPLKSGSKVELVTTRSPDALEVVRHSAAHVMAQAVQAIWPDVKVTIGPVVENGFYYDFDSPRPFSPDDLARIESEMIKIIQRDLPIERQDVRSAEARALFEKMGETYKLELIDSIGEPSVGIYHTGKEWLDLCRGPHIQRTGQIGAVKVMSLAGAYWRGDEKRQQLQRIYATAFLSKKELEEHLLRLEEAKKRDHRKLGKELGLFLFHNWAPAAPFFTGKGTTIYNELVAYVRELYVKYGYQEVITPQVFDVELFKTSGHFQNYRENMFFAEVDESAQKEKLEGVDQQKSSLKPMNCPGHCLLFGSEKRSYRDLPWRVADFGRLHRFERSGVIHGLTRVRSFCQDDAHIFCRYEQIQTEIAQFISMTKEAYDLLGMNNFKIYVSTRPENRMGSDEMWDMAEGALMRGLEERGLPFAMAPGDGAFYGPKIEIHFVDAIGRSWTLGTIQVDPNLPQAFGLEYTGEDNTPHRPYILHRAILGSLERFIGIYIEHCAGHFPTWLAPTQVVVMNITDRQSEACRSLVAELRASGVRAEFDSRNEKLGYKVREAQMQKVPYMITLGDREVEAGQVSVRLASGQTVAGVSRGEFVKRVVNEIRSRSLRPDWLVDSGAGAEGPTQ
jgi:threonyl-tRNA synthetase